MAEWDQRQLCSDGSCIGLIGPGGTCKVCGRVAQNWGDERKRGLADDAEPVPSDADDEDDDDEYEDDDEDGEDEDDEDGEYDDDDEDDEPDPIAPSTPARIGEPADWQARKLCTDGSCIGVIGPDGRCKVCGKRAAGKPELVPDVPTTEAALEAVADAMAPALAAGGAANDEAPDENRTLCSDESCIGVLGLDGRCKVCGKVGAA